MGRCLSVMIDTLLQQQFVDVVNNAMFAEPALVIQMSEIFCSSYSLILISYENIIILMKFCSDFMNFENLNCTCGCLWVCNTG